MREDRTPQRTDQELDTRTDDKGTGLLPSPPATAPYQIEVERERKRGFIAVMLVWLLVGTVASAFIMAYLKSFTTFDLGGLLVKDVKEILTIIFSPIVALVGTVTGFYFGGKSEGGQSGKPANGT